MNSFFSPINDRHRMGARAFSYQALLLQNHLPPSVRSADTLSCGLRTFLFDEASSYSWLRLAPRFIAIGLGCQGISHDAPLSFILLSGSHPWVVWMYRSRPAGWPSLLILLSLLSCCIIAATIHVNVIVTGSKRCISKLPYPPLSLSHSCLPFLCPSLFIFPCHCHQHLLMGGSWVSVNNCKEFGLDLLYMLSVRS